ncbi:Cytochrome c7 c [uncultured archaeon]|nr:Cytochrome c7 c [uncultured archaeon]
MTFNLALPGGYSATTAALYDIDGNPKASSIFDMGGYVNVTFIKTLSPYEGKVYYLYFERPLTSGPYTASMSSLQAPYSVANGTVEGYAITFTQDKNMYSAGETLVLTTKLRNVTGDSIIDNVTTVIYYPNGTAAQVNLTQANATGEALANYTIPAIKGRFTAVTNATVNGLMRMENTSFNVGDLAVNISIDKTIYNTLENVSINVNVTENGNTTASDLTLRIYDPSSIKVFEQTRNTTAPVNFIFTLPTSPLGNYTITAGASTGENAGYNTTIFELDQFDINTATDRAVYTASGTTTASGITTYRGAGANASVNIIVKKNLAFNPSFETDLDNNSLPDGWRGAGDGIKTQDTVPRTGSYSARILKFPANATEGEWNYSSLYVISPGTGYTFSVWAKTDNSTGGNLRLWVEWYNGTGSISTAINTQRTIWEQNGWVSLQGSASSPANADNVKIHLVSDTVGNVWFDDLNIEPENNSPVYTANITSNTSYSATFSLTNASSYILYANGSYVANGTLGRSNTTVFSVRRLDVNTSAGGPFESGAGNVTITGYATDNRTGMAIPNATVYFNITYPNSTLINYTNTTNVQGYYNHTIRTPQPGGTYRVNISVKDYQDVTGTANVTFRVRLNLSVQTNRTQYNPNETAQITVNVSDSTTGISGGVVNITVSAPSNVTRNFSTLYGNVTDRGSGIYSANYSDTTAAGIYTVNASASNGTDNGNASASFRVRRLNVTIQDISAKVGESRSIFARVEDETNATTIANAAVNMTISNLTSIVNQINTTSLNQSGYNILSQAFTDQAGKYNVTINATDTDGIRGNALLPYTVNLSVNLTLSQTAYNPGENITAVIAVRENISTSGSLYGAAVVATLTRYDGTIISSNTTATNTNGEAVVNFTAPDDYSSYFVNVTSSKNGIDGTASHLFATSNLRIWTDKGEVLIGGSAWASNSAPEEYRNITLKVAVLDSAGLRRTGQSLTALVYYPNGTLYGTYPLSESDKTYSTSVLFPGKSIPEGNYSFQIAEYPGTGENFSVMIWGCARCHRPNSITMHYNLHDDTSIAPSDFSINHTHKSISNTCDWHNYGGDASCSGCHRNETGSTGGPTKCKTCHNSADHPNEGYLNDTYGADIHANINTKPGGSWYGKETACQSCHGNITDPPRVPQCTLCHPSSSGSGMQGVPGNLSGSNTTLENFEDVSDVTATSGYRFSTVSISTSTTNKSGSFSGQVDYSLGAGFGRVYIDRKNLDLTNATSISLWVYGDNSNTTLYLAINNTRSTKVNWHQSSPMQVNWTGWRKISVPIKELSQHDLLYISFSDTVRIKLETESESGSSGTILIDDMKKEQIGSHTQYKEIECGLCHGGRHNLERPPNCETCHQTEGHGWPERDKYPQANATCMNCHQSDVSGNSLNISGLIKHADVLADFENNSIFAANLTSFGQSHIYYAGPNNDSGNHSAVLNYTGLTDYLGNSLNATNASRYKGITVMVNSSIDANTQLVLGVYTTAWYNYTVPLDWNGWREIRVLFHNSTVNESASFNATGTVSSLWIGVYGSGSTGSVYFDNLRLAVDDNYHQYEAWPCTDCHIQVGNIPGITDITSPIRECSYCHNRSEPHAKDFNKNCMYCHFDSGHGEVDSSFTDYEKASTCLKCHTMPHNFSSIHLTTSDCNNCHQQRIHGQNAQSVAYNASQHLDCERCHGKTSTGALPLERGSPASIFLRFSYTYNNESQCIFCHEDSINAYMLHTNQTVNTSNLTLVEGIRNNTICSTCHGSKSVSNALDRDELTTNDSRAEPHPIQIAGHGNVSCYKCHGHRPETLILTVGSNCVGCHQDAEKLVELIPGKLNDSDLTSVTNPGASQLIVHPPQTTGHGNTSCNNCHGHSNSNLTFVGSTAVSCTNCHQNTSSTISLLDYRQPNSTRSSVTNPGGNPLYVIPPQVQGHGNASCRECHDHAPSTFSSYNFVAGSSCESCHQNTTRNVSLIENSVPSSGHTVVLDNTTSSWIVRAPQVAGHGRTACSECHTHSAESLVFYGQNDRDCVLCHYNASAKSYRLQDGSSAQPTQIIPHKDLNCTECHGHTPAGMTRVLDCSICHQNTTKAQSLTDTYGAGLNITSPQGQILAVQVPGLYHSNSPVAGGKWNKTAAYWTNSTAACQYCHEISRNYSMHDPLGRASTLAGSNTRNSSISGQYWCASCHYQGYSSGGVTYNDMVRVFSEASLPIPPEITLNSSYGSYTTSNDGTKYYNHDLSDYSDVGCAGCHGTSNTTKDFLHYVTVGVGGSNCLDCHDNATSKPVAFSAYGMSAHKNLNCVDCHTPRQVKNGIIVGSESRVYNFSVPNNSRWLNETLDWNGSSILNLTLYAPNLTAYYGQVNVPMPQAGNWIAILRSAGDDARYSFSVNVSWTHPGSSPKACENCHVSDFGTAPIVFKHIPGVSSVPTNASCVSCHARGAQAARTSALAASHYLSVSPMDTRDCVGCHINASQGFGTPPDPRNHTRYTPVNMTLVSGNTWELADNYSLALIEATREGAIFEFEKDGEMLKRELVAGGDVFRYEVSGVGTENISVVDLTVKRLFTANNLSAVELSGNVLATRIHREKDNNSCYACHDSEYRANRPDGMDYYVLDKTTENVTLALMPANFSALDTRMLSVGEEWDIGEGYSLRVADAGTTRGNAQLQVFRNGTLIEDIIINEGNYITHEEWVFGRKINVFSAKLERIFVGTKPAVSGLRLAEYNLANSTVIVLSDVRLIAGEQQTRNATTQILQEGVQLKYLSLDDRITIGKEPTGFHVYTLTQGGYSSDCISCHTGSGVAPVKIDPVAFRNGVHAGLNRNATYTGFITDDVNKACWACHGNGSEPSEHPVSYPGNDTPKTCISCHGYFQFGAKQVYSHYPGAGISTGASCNVCHSNTLVNKTVSYTSHYSTRKGLLNTSDCGGCHANATNASKWGNAPLVLKHNSSNNCTLCHAGYRIATFHDKGLTITRRCEDCHVNREKAEKFNLSVIRTHYPDAPESMANTLKQSNYTCRDCHNATNNTLHSSLIVREYQNMSMGNCFQCHSEEGNFPHKAGVQIGALRHGLGIKVLSGCETCHAIEGVSKFHTPSLVGKQYFSSAGNYRVECTTCHEEHEGRKYQPYENIQCVDCHSEYGAAHYGNAQITLVKESGACLRCHNEEAETFHNLTRIVGNVTDAAYEPCRTCHDDLEALKDAQNASSMILRGNMFNTSSISNSSFRTCTSCHNASGEGRFHYSSYPRGTVQNPGWNNWTAGLITGCKDCHTYQGGERPFNATNMGMEGTSPAGTAHGFAPNCTLCHGGADPVGFHSLAASGFIPRLGVTLKPESVSAGEKSMIQATVVLAPLMKVTRAEYFIDKMGDDGQGYMLEYVVGNSSTSASLLGAVMNTSDLSFGTHLVFVHVKESSGKWSKPEIAVLTVTKPRGLEYAEIFLKDIVPALILIGFIFFIWKWYR